MTKCPNCKLLNPSDSRLCDCGYDFKTRAVASVDKSETAPAESFLANARWWVLLAAFAVRLVATGMRDASGEPMTMVIFANVAMVGLLILAAVGFAQRKRQK